MGKMEKNLVKKVEKMEKEIEARVLQEEIQPEVEIDATELELAMKLKDDGYLIKSAYWFDSLNELWLDGKLYKLGEAEKKQIEANLLVLERKKYTVRKKKPIAFTVDEYLEMIKNYK
jgi:hypothetical protein